MSTPNLSAIDTKKAELLELQVKAQKFMQNPDWTAEERKDAAEAMAKIEVLKSELELRNSLEGGASFIHSDDTRKVEVKAGQPGGISDEYDGNAKERHFFDVKTWNTICSNPYKQVFHKYLALKGDLHKMSLDEIKTLQEASDGSGGFLVPQDYVQEMIMKQPAPTTVLGMVRKFTTSRDQIVLPKMLNTADNIFTSAMRMVNAGEVLPNANTALSATPAFQQVTIPVYTITGNLPASLNIFEDSAFDVVGMLSDQFAMFANLYKDQQILVGDGNGNPIGLTTLAGGAIGGLTQIPNYSISSGSAPTSVADAAMKIPYNVPPQYDDKFAYILNKTNTAQYIAQLKSSTNQYLFSYGLQDQNLASARPRELCGYPLVWDSFMPDMTTAAGNTTVKTSGVPLMFGDLSGYFLVERVGFSVRVLDQPLYTQNQMQIAARFRVGGAPVEEWKFVAGVCAA